MAFFRQGIRYPEIRDRITCTVSPVIVCAQERLRPISISAFTTIAALIPTAGAFFGPTPQKELAVSIIGGLSLSTVSTLLLVPLFTSGKLKKR